MNNWVFDNQEKIYIFKGGGKTDSRGQYQPKDYYGFSGDMYSAMYQAFKDAGYRHIDAVRLARFVTAHKAMESGYGSHIFGKNEGITYNYGGIGGQEAKQSFSDMADYAKSYVELLKHKYPNSLKATTLQEYSNGLFMDDYGYDPYDIDGNPTSDPKKYNKAKSQQIYWDKVKGTEKRSGQNIDQWLKVNSRPQSTKKSVQQTVVSPPKSWWQPVMEPIINNPILYNK